MASRPPASPQSNFWGQRGEPPRSPEAGAPGASGAAAGAGGPGRGGGERGLEGESATARGGARRAPRARGSGDPRGRGERGRKGAPRGAGRRWARGKRRTWREGGGGGGQTDRKRGSEVIHRRTQEETQRDRCGEWTPEDRRAEKPGEEGGGRRAGGRQRIRKGSPKARAKAGKGPGGGERRPLDSRTRGPGGGGRTDQGRERRTGWLESDEQMVRQEGRTGPQTQRDGRPGMGHQRHQPGGPSGGGCLWAGELCWAVRGEGTPALRLPPSSPGCVQGARPQSQVSLSSHGRGGAASPSLLGGERVLQPLLPLLAVSGHPVAGRPEVWESHPE